MKILPLPVLACLFFVVPPNCDPKAGAARAQENPPATEEADADDRHTNLAEKEFLSPTIDLGLVVSDVDKAAEFYTKAIGFKEIEGFKVPADFATKAGLTENRALDIRVLVLDPEAEFPTRLKIMKGEGAGTSDNATIDAELGFSYLTIVVKSTEAALARLAKAGVRPIAEGPVTLPEELNPHLALTIVRDPDGNVVELVGPKPSAPKDPAE